MTAFAGIALTVFGIGLVIADRRSGQEAPGLFPGTVNAGVMYGLAGALCQATGIAIAKIGMASCDPLTASFVRLAAAGLAALPLIALTGRWQRTWADVVRPSVLKRLIPAAMIGTWLGIWFSQIAVLNCDIAVATTLMTTSPLFAIPLVRIFYGHPIRIRALMGTFLALLGIFLIV
jgi:drug/metabolite transporter (DMT)-like permease